MRSFDDGEHVVVEGLWRYDLFGKSLWIGDENHSAPRIELLDHFGAHEYVGVVGLFGLVRLAVGCREEEHPLTLDFVARLVEECLDVVLEVVSVLFRGNDEEEIAVGINGGQCRTDNRGEASCESLDVNTVGSRNNGVGKPSDDF